MEKAIDIDGNGNIVFHNIDGSVIVVNKNDSDEIRKLAINLGSDIKSIPQEVLRLMEEKSDAALTVKANIYLTVLMEYYEYDAQRTKLKFGLTITNLAKEHRYFNSPFFVVNPKFTVKEGVEHDTFSMIPVEGNVFSKRLEYGEPFSVTFDIKPGGYKIYEEIVQKDSEAEIQAFIVTTLGEVFESNKFKVKKLLEYRDSIS